MSIIVVTGGAGFIGSALIRKLVQLRSESTVLEFREVERIYSLDDYSSGSRKNCVDAECVSYVTGHTTSIGQLHGIVGSRRVSYLFHLGEYSRIATSFEDVATVNYSNLCGTAAVLEAWRRWGCKLIYSGSSSVFVDPALSPYAYTKRHNVDLIRNYQAWFGAYLRYAITYFYNVYGPGQLSEGRMATVLGIFQKAYEEGRPLPVVLPGTQRRDFTHVDDVVRGMLKAALYGDGDGYTLATGKSYSILDVAAQFGCDVEMKPERPGERFNSEGNYEKARAELDWIPKHDVLTYVREWVAAQKQKGS